MVKVKRDGGQISIHTRIPFSFLHLPKTLLVWCRALMPPSPLYNWVCVLHSVSTILSHAASIRAAQASRIGTTLTATSSTSLRTGSARQHLETQTSLLVDDNPDSLQKATPAEDLPIEDSKGDALSSVTVTRQRTSELPPTPNSTEVPTASRISYLDGDRPGSHGLVELEGGLADSVVSTPQIRLSVALPTSLIQETGTRTSYTFQQIREYQCAICADWNLRPQTH